MFQAERAFLSLQSRRHESQMKMSDIQSRLKQIRLELMQVHRGDDRFIPLVTEEDGIIKEENQLKDTLTSCEKEERNKFAELSAAVRESHEKERARTERTKYWSVVGSFVGVVLGVIGTTINNYRRMKELRSLVRDSTTGGAEMHSFVSQVTQVIENQQKNMSDFLSELKNSAAPERVVDEVNAKGQKDRSNFAKSRLSQDDFKEESKQLIIQSDQILDSIKRQESFLNEEITNVKQLLGIEASKKSDGNIVYVGPEMREMLLNTEENMGRKIKLNTLLNVTLVYAGFALTLPIIYSIFRGGS